MLFMLWIKNKFSECLAPLHKHEGPLGDGSAQARRHGGGGIRDNYQIFCEPQILFCSENFVLNIRWKQKYFPLKMYLPKP